MERAGAGEERGADARARRGRGARKERRGEGVESAGAAKRGNWPGEGRQRAEQKRPRRYGVPKGSVPRAEGAGRSEGERGPRSLGGKARRLRRGEEGWSAPGLKERGRGTRKGSAGLRAVESLPESRPHDAGSPGCTPRTLDMGDPGG